MTKILLIMIGLSFGLMADLVRDTDTGIVSDSSTGLEWQDTAMSGVVVWDSAISACEDLDLGTHTDWRLPNINALKSIIDTNNDNPAISGIFTETGNVFWSSTSAKSIEGNAWIVDFHNGNVNVSDKNDTTANVRCVRTRD